MACLAFGDLAEDLRSPRVAHSRGEDCVHGTSFDLSTPRLEEAGDSAVVFGSRAHAAVFAEITSTGCFECRTSSWLVLPSKSSATPPLPCLPTTTMSAFSRSATSLMTDAARPSSIRVRYRMPATFSGLHHLLSNSALSAARPSVSDLTRRP